LATNRGDKAPGKGSQRRTKLVQPDFTKTDLKKLKQALPKYELHFDAKTKKWWKPLEITMHFPTDIDGCYLS